MQGEGWQQSRVAFAGQQPGSRLCFVVAGTKIQHPKPLVKFFADYCLENPQGDIL